MVIDTLLKNVATVIRTGLSVTTAYVEVRPDAYPPAGMGKWFIAVYGGRFQRVHEESYCIRGTLTINLTMTMRTSAIPFDRQGTDLSCKTTTGMIAIWENALAALDGNASTIVGTSNTTIGYVGVESVPVLLTADSEAKAVRGGGPLGWLNAENEERAAYIMEAKYKVHINRNRS